MNITRDIRCQNLYRNKKCRKLLAKNINSELIVTNETIWNYKNLNCIEIVCKRCKEKNYIVLKKENDR